MTEQSPTRTGSSKFAARLRKILVYGSVALFSSCSTAMYLKIPLKMAEPPLLQGLSGDRQRASEEFDARVKERFPIGSSAFSLERELWRQGFQWAEDRKPGVRRAFTPAYFKFICQGIDAGVEWEADDIGGVRSVRGFFPGLTCFDMPRPAGG